ncbi:MAG: hypothetical protein JW953_07670 [Anaerolineae bacterium]|nr:hypothetical protein [Anaerolineae bacterium]
MKYRNFLSIATFIWLFIVAGILPVPAAAQSSEEPVVQAVLFYSNNCYHCHQVISQLLIPMQDKYGEQLQILGLETSEPSTGELFQAAIAYYQIPPEYQGVPFLIIGDTVLVGSQQIPQQLPAIVEAALAADGIGWPNFPGFAQVLAATGPAPEPSPSPQPTDTPTPAAVVALAGAVEPVYLAYFYDPSCLECARVSRELAEIQAGYPQVVIRKFNVQEEAPLNETICDQYDVPDEYRLASPMIFIGQEYLGPGEITLERLKNLVEAPAAAKASPPWESIKTNQAEVTARITERFKHFGVLAVAGAGLLDGVNPCAFTTIIFFVSYLALVGRKGREILLVGAAFTLAVFLTYLMMGLGLAEVLRRLKSLTLIGQIIYGVTALICLVLAFISISDYLKIRRGQLAEISLQLPKALKKRIHGTIRTHSRMRGYIGAAFVAGVLVSVFELACTGQVYLPTIIFVTGVADLRVTAIAYLALYNLMFVVPLMAVFMITYLGTGSRQLTTLFQTHAGTVKLLTAVLFGVLGVWVGYMVLTV